DGPPTVAVPKVVGLARADAADALTRAGFALLPDETRYSSDVAADKVIDVTPKVGTQVQPDTQAKLIVSKGHAPVDVPDVRGKSFADAKQTLEDRGFKTSRGTDAFSNTYPSGQVMATTPGAGTNAPYGSNVEIVVSKGPDLVTVPNLLRQLFG